MPFGIVIDTKVCLAAPEILWFSGIGDLVAKFTAVFDCQESPETRSEIARDRFHRFATNVNSAGDSLQGM